jgi:hypothetical protein
VHWILVVPMAAATVVLVACSTSSGGGTNDVPNASTYRCDPQMGSCMTSCSSNLPCCYAETYEAGIHSCTCSDPAGTTCAAVLHQAIMTDQALGGSAWLVDSCP